MREGEEATEPLIGLQIAVRMTPTVAHQVHEPHTAERMHPVLLFRCVRMVVEFVRGVEEAVVGASGRCPRTVVQEDALMESSGSVGNEMPQHRGVTAVSVPPAFHLFVALGDSFTEGMGDPNPGSPGGYRGWADLVAEELGAGSSEFAYANLAVRGLLVRQIVSRQVGLAVDLRPDLVTFQAGGNDLIHPGADPDRLADQVEPAIGALVAVGAVVLMFVGPDSGPGTVLGRFRSKVAVYNENLRGIAARQGAVVADLWAMSELSELRMWDNDRLHLSASGHRAVAAMVLDTLNVPHLIKPTAGEPLQASDGGKGRTGDLMWIRQYLLPWVVEGIRRQGAGTQATAKRPLPGPVGADTARLGSRDGTHTT